MLMLARWSMFSLVLAILSTPALAYGQGSPDSEVWEFTSGTAAALSVGPGAQPMVSAHTYATVRLNSTALSAALQQAPMELATQAVDQPLIMALPLPDESLGLFRIVESPVMAPALAAKYPDIKTYVGQGIDDPSASVRLSRTPKGFRAQIFCAQGAYYIDPLYEQNTAIYACYRRIDMTASGGFECLTELIEEDQPDEPDSSAISAQSGVAMSMGTGTPVTLRTFRLAVAATGNFTQYHDDGNSANGDAVADTMASITEAVNRVTGIYERDFAVRLELVANNDLLIFTDPVGDGYEDGDEVPPGTPAWTNQLWNANQSIVDNTIGSSSYDVGHVFGITPPWTTNLGSGLAGIGGGPGVVCNFANKARGVSTHKTPSGDPFWVDYVAHELGHQFDANHTWNGSLGSCSSGSHVSSTAYEPGSGSTIMAYAGICQTDNLQLNSDPYFHSASIEEVTNFIQFLSCDVETQPGNQFPMIDAGPDYTIPHSTPFTLTAASWDDPDKSDTLTFSWEQRDAGSRKTLCSLDDGFSPLFRFFPPVSDPSRTFPQLDSILNLDILNQSVLCPTGEQLPTVGRNMDFRVTARDNAPGSGGTGFDDMVVTVHAAAGPFRITSFNSTGSHNACVSQTVTWDVAGTDLSPIQTDFVDILFSTDGGQTFPVVLASNTANDGSESVSFPSYATSAGRIKVQAVGNIFFDISDADITVNPAAPGTIDVTGTGNHTIDDSFGNRNGLLETGESRVNLLLELISDCYSLTNVVGTLASLTPTVTVTQDAVFYPDLIGQVPTANEIPFIIDINSSHACGDPVNLRLTIDSDQGSDTIDFVFSTGSAGDVVLFSDNFENTSSGNWSLSGLWHYQDSSACLNPTPGYQSPTHALVYNQEATCDYDTGAQTMGSAAMTFDVTIPANALSAQLSWKEYVEVETGFDMQKVELSLDGGLNWDQELSNTTDSNPVWETETRDLSAYIGQSVRLRFMFDTGDAIANDFDGWYLDDVRLSYVSPNAICRSVHNTTQDLWYDDIQPAVDDAGTGDTIVAYPGVYDTVDFLGKAITVTGADPDNWDMVRSTVITPTAASGSVLFQTSEGPDSVLAGLHLNGSWGVYCNGSGPTIRNCYIHRNTGGGGVIGIFVTATGTPAPVIANNWIKGPYWWGIIMESTSSGQFINNLVQDTTTYGVDIRSTAVEVANNTIVNNNRGIAGAAGLVVRNSIIWDNTDGVVGSGMTFEYSCIQESVTGSNNIFTDPLFMNAAQGNYHLQMNSPCRDMGDDSLTYNGQFDIDGQPRVLDDRVDMGADEVLADTVINQRTCLEYRHIQDAVDAALDGDTLVVYPGTYETVNFMGKAVTVTGTDPDDWDVVRSTAITLATNGASAFFQNSEGPDSVLTGLRLNSTWGVYCSGASPTVRRCLISRDSGMGGLVGIYVAATGTPAPILTNNWIKGAYWYGVLMETTSSGQFINNLVQDTTTRGVDIRSAAVEVANNTIVNNNIGFAGAAGLVVRNSIVWGNTDGVSLGNNATFEYSCIQESVTGSNNIFIDPLFVDPIAGDYHIQSTSPCRNTGDPGGSYILQLDLDAGNRVNEGQVDRGADEFGS